MEILKPDATPSAWRDFLDAHGPSIHHIAFRVQGMKGNTVTQRSHDCLKRLAAND